MGEPGAIWIKEGAVITLYNNANIIAVESQGIVTLLTSEQEVESTSVVARFDFIHWFSTPESSLH